MMSQTHTQTLQRTVVNPTRNHDYLYDPNYVLSSEKDHARDTYKSHTKIDRIKRVPEFRQMFSSLPHFPRFQVRLDNTDPVPKFINRRWRGYANQNREALVRYTTFNYDPSVQVPSVRHEDPKVTGQNRYKYFRRPIIPFLQQVPPEVLLQPTTVDPLAPPTGALQRPPTPATQTIAIQTDYRDSEAQTDPYTPEYVVRPGSAPELLTLATLTYNHGLPAGLAEVEMIERARAKRAWEKTLPPINDLSQMEKRKRMMDDMETKEWLLREQEIEKLQEERLEVLKRLLVQREIKQQELNDQRLDKLWAKKQKLKEKNIHKIRKEHLRTIRRLTHKCENVEGKFQRKDYIKEYSKFGSQVHAPLTRIGVFLDRGSEQYVVRSRYLNTFQGLLELEASLPDFVTQPRVKAPKKPSMVVNGYVKKKFRLTKQLEDMHNAIKEAKKIGEEPPKPLRFLHKVEKPIPRPPTPTVEVPSEDLEEEELAAIFLQKVIRGRAIQNMMFEGKEKRLELINEVRSTHALQKAEQLIKTAEKQNVVTLQRQRRLYQHKESYVNEVLSQVEGDSIGDLLDFLSKELIRLQEERRIHAISMLAERRRRLREAEESGKRQVEERRRREEDEIFKQLVKIHQSTVDTYLEDMIMTSVDGTADEQARDEIRLYADKINDIAYEMEDKRTYLQSEEIVSELVHSFLMPEVLKNNFRDKIKQDQKKHLFAAHRIIHASTEPIIAKSRPASSRRENLSGNSSPIGSPSRRTSIRRGTNDSEIQGQTTPIISRSKSPKSPEMVDALGQLLDSDRVASYQAKYGSHDNSQDKEEVTESIIVSQQQSSRTPDEQRTGVDPSPVSTPQKEIIPDLVQTTSEQSEVVSGSFPVTEQADDQIKADVSLDLKSSALLEDENLSLRSSKDHDITDSGLVKEEEEEMKQASIDRGSPNRRTEPSIPTETLQTSPIHSKSDLIKPVDSDLIDPPSSPAAKEILDPDPRSDLAIPTQMLPTEKAARKSISGSPSLSIVDDQAPAADESQTKED